MSTTYQWLYGNNWIDCTPENNSIISKRVQEPSLLPLTLKNAFGKLEGSFETGEIHFIIHGGESDAPLGTRIRPGALPGELPVYAAISGNSMALFSYEASRVLFHDGKPRSEKVTLHYGTNTYVAQNEELFHMMANELVPRRWKAVDVSKAQFDLMTETRYKWRFKGPMRWPRMCQAVASVLEDMAEDQRAILREHFENLNPSEDNTEYGPYQFPDYLSSLGLQEMAILVADVFQSIPDDEWRYFDPVTNRRIEDARQQNRPMVIIEAHNQKYMIVFDVGGGASGASSVLVRPMRYQKILESIEEQFHETMVEEHETTRGRLADVLREQQVPPNLFLMAMMTNHSILLDRLDEPHKTEVAELLERLSTPGSNLSTRIQQFLPVLLNKFKECDIEMSQEEHVEPKKLESKIVKTAKTGLCIPETNEEHSQCLDFKELVYFIQSQQCWLMPKGKNRCDICGDSGQKTLTHCGTASACLKCWCDSLVKTNMSCPFCRGTVEGKTLKLAAAVPTPKLRKKAPTNKRKRKRDAFETPEEILQEIHKDAKYAAVSLASKEPMRKWFTILVRRKLVGITQMPRNEQGKKSFVEAMKIFKLLS